MSNSPQLPVHWLSLGGTIQAVGHDLLDTTHYWQTGQSLSPEELLAPVQDLVGPVTAEQGPTRPSHDLDAEDLFALLNLIRGLDPSQCAGAVVTMGSNGLEEIAFAAWLVGAPVPVAMTAAMRPPSAAGSDALPNLVDAIAVARSLSAREHGVVVVSDGVMLHPAEASKSHSGRVDSFRASAVPLGEVAAGGVRWFGQPRRGPLAGRDLPQALAPVEIVTSYLGADGAAIRSAAARGVAAIVSAGTGAGFPTSAERKALAEAAEAGVVVCQAQRTPYGPVTSPGGGWLGARTLTPAKVRLLLAFALAAGLGVGEIQEAIDSCWRGSA